jgi:hypothetical protein
MLNVKDVKPAVVETPVVIEPKPFNQKVPYLWTIVKTDKGIHANSDMGDVFEGTIEEFNRQLKA